MDSVPRLFTSISLGFVHALHPCFEMHIEILEFARWSIDTTYYKNVSHYAFIVQVIYNRLI